MPKRFSTFLAALLAAGHLMAGGAVWAAEPAVTAAPESPPATSETPAPPAAQPRPRIPGSLSLDADGTPFDALLAEQTRGKPLGAVVLVPDVDTPPDWAAVVGPLRRRLPAGGWTTLALSVPRLPNATTASRLLWLDAVRPRIGAGVRHLAGMDIGNIAVVGYGLGALAAADYLRTNLDGAVRGLVVIGIPSQPDAPRLNAAEALKQVPVPVLDIFGGRDRPTVTAMAAERAALVRKAAAARTTSGAPATYAGQRPERLTYRQVRVAGAGHDFRGHDELLVRRIRGWLNRTASGPRIKTDPKELLP